jgi:hypothetical protein
LKRPADNILSAWDQGHCGDIAGADSLGQIKQIEESITGGRESTLVVLVERMRILPANLRLSGRAAPERHHRVPGAALRANFRPKGDFSKVHHYVNDEVNTVCIARRCGHDCFTELAKRKAP